MYDTIHFKDITDRVPSEDEVRIRKKSAQSNSDADLPISFNILLNHIMTNVKKL